MITTGVPVSIALTEWLANYASTHLDWFDATTTTHHQIQQYLNGKNNITPEDFVRFLLVMLALFDGEYLQRTFVPFTQQTKNYL